MKRHDCLYRKLQIIYNTKKKPSLLKQIGQFSKITGYKINKQKSIASLYTKNEPVDNKIKNTIPLTITKKNLSCKSNQMGTDSYAENY